MLRRGRGYRQEFGPGEILFDLGNFHLDRFARNHVRHKDHHLIEAANAFTAKGDVLDGQGDAVTGF